MKYSELLSNVLMDMPTPGLQNPNVPDLSVQAPQEAKPADQLLPDVSTPNKPFELREAVMRKPSNRPLAKKIANPYPTVSKILKADLVEEKDNLHRLGIETEEEFGTKYKGQLEQKAEEHDLGDLLGYALLPTHIMIWGSENCMELTYDLEDPMVNKVYYFDVGIAQDEPAPIAEEPEDA